MHDRRRVFVFMRNQICFLSRSDNPRYGKAAEVEQSSLIKKLEQLESSKVTNLIVKTLARNAKTLEAYRDRLVVEHGGGS